MTTTRNLVLGFDGTWNEPDLKEDGKPIDTNVVKFMRAMKRVRGGLRQHYEKGVGTRAWEALPGGIYGYGLDKRVLGGYRFLCNRFADEDLAPEDNRIFIIGFSRGAYTARRLAGMIQHCGLPADPEDTELGLEVYRDQDFETARVLKQSRRFVEVPIEFVGVWDTVKSTNDPDFNDAVLPECVKAGYHAMAIDERRRFFPVLRWKKDARVLENWFAGVHSDVGGGYASQGLSDIALKWMIYRAYGHGLEFKQRYLDENVKPRALGKQHESYEGIWKPLGEKYRKVRGRDFVHPSVAERLEKKRPKYAPKNLPASPRYWSPGNA